MRDEREARLREILTDIQSCVVAFSGGVDSAYLAVVANDVLAENALAVTAASPSYPMSQRRTAEAVVQQFGIRHEMIRSTEMRDPNYVANTPDRCYFCKQELYTRLQDIARSRGFRHVVDGNNVDDIGDYRPGRRAAADLQVRSPLIEANLRKADIRELSRKLGLQTWNQPASACLSSRIPYGSEVTPEKLRMIERSEELLRSLGFSQCRVRHHGEVARIEIERTDLARAMNLELFDTISRGLKKIGFKFVALDLDGYRTGALNEVLSQIQIPQS
jgi:pyridinium-3,5-biscarboxylic acid mononucleotide sulfurtransferase